jgi:hypothetical protein
MTADCSCLKYRIYEAQNVPLEERIEVLENLKKKELKLQMDI